MKSLAPLQPGRTYHIYNRGNNREDLFREERNYPYFLQLYTRHIHPIAETFTYCLLKNHFHFFIRVREISLKTSRVLETREVSQHFSNFFNAYTKAINKVYQRTGSLFEERFERIEVNTDSHFLNLIFYIHFNPQKHGFVDDFRNWPWSSYNTLRTSVPTKLNRAEVILWFGSTSEFEAFHRGKVDERLLDLTGLEDL